MKATLTTLDQMPWGMRRWAYHLPVLSVLVASTCSPGEELVDGVFLGPRLGTTFSHRLLDIF